MNFEALHKFWNLTDYLKTDQPLTDSLWIDFYNVKGNKLYIENNVSVNDLAAYRESLEIVFRPCFKKKLREKLLKNDEWVIRVHRYKEYENEFKFFEKILREPNYVDLIYDHAFAQLPKSMHNKDSRITIYIMAIGADAAAHKKSIFCSLHIAYFFDQYKKGAIVGHELHHILRKEFPFKTKIQKKHKGIMYLLNGILNEGVADLIDKSIVLEHNDELPAELQWKSKLLSYSREIIKKIDSSINKVYHLKGEFFLAENDYREMVMHSSGHIPGFFMAKVIVENGYYEHMIENISNPFMFLKLYNLAAKKDKENPPTFSPETINYIETMELYYKK